MTTQDAKLRIAIEVADRTSKGLKTAQSGLEKFNTQLKQIRGPLLAITGGLAGVAGVSVKMASDLEESINAVNVVFGKGADTVLAFGKTSARAVGLSTAAFNQMSTQTGALLKDTGLSVEEVANQTIALTVRASDMASVFNTSVNDALSAINQALRGETEAIRRYAGDVTDATLETFALAQGIEKSVAEMTQQEKRLLRVALLMEQTSVTAGDFARTSDSLANQVRITRSELTNVAAELGTQLIPIATKVIGVFSSIIQTFSEFPPPIKTAILIVGGITAGLATLGLALPPIIAGFSMLTGVLFRHTTAVGAATAAHTGLAAAATTSGAAASRSAIGFGAMKLAITGIGSAMLGPVGLIGSIASLAALLAPKLFEALGRSKDRMNDVRDAAQEMGDSFGKVQPQTQRFIKTLNEGEQALFQHELDIIANQKAIDAFQASLKGFDPAVLTNKIHPIGEAFVTTSDAIGQSSELIAINAEQWDRINTSIETAQPRIEETQVRWTRLRMTLAADEEFRTANEQLLSMTQAAIDAAEATKELEDRIADNREALEKSLDKHKEDLALRRERIIAQREEEKRLANVQFRVQHLTEVLGVHTGVLKQAEEGVITYDQALFLLENQLQSHQQTVQANAQALLEHQARIEANRDAWADWEFQQSAVGQKLEELAPKWADVMKAVADSSDLTMAQVQFILQETGVAIGDTQSVIERFGDAWVDTLKRSRDESEKGLGMAGLLDDANKLADFLRSQGFEVQGLRQAKGTRNDELGRQGQLNAAIGARQDAITHIGNAIGNIVGRASFKNLDAGALANLEAQKQQAKADQKRLQEEINLLNLNRDRFIAGQIDERGIIAGLQHGGTVLKPGIVKVGESGPELLHLPAGSRVSSNAALQRMESGSGSVNVTFNQNAPVFGFLDFEQQVVEVWKKVRLADGFRDVIDG